MYYVLLTRVGCGPDLLTACALWLMGTLEEAG